MYINPPRRKEAEILNLHLSWTYISCSPGLTTGAQSSPAPLQCPTAKSANSTSSITICHPLHQTDHLQVQHMCKFSPPPSTCQCQAQGLPQMTFRLGFVQDWTHRQIGGLVVTKNSSKVHWGQDRACRELRQQEWLRTGKTLQRMSNHSREGSKGGGKRVMWKP